MIISPKKDNMTEEELREAYAEAIKEVERIRQEKEKKPDTK